MPFPAETNKGTRVGVEPGATGWQQDVSESVARLDDFALDQWAYDRVASSGLTYGFRGGVIVSGGAYALIAAGTVALTDNTVNYVQRDSAGAVTVSAAGFDAAKTPMAKVTTQGGAITNLADWRPVFPAAGGGGGGVAGTGTAGTIPKWTAAATLGDSIITEAAGVITITGGLTVTGALSFAASAVAWSMVNKAGSSLADLATRSASDLSSGTLPTGRIAGSYTGLTGTGALAAGSIATGFGGAAFGADVTIGAPAAAPTGGANLHMTEPLGGGLGTRIVIDAYSDTGNNGNALLARRARGTKAAPTAVLSGDVLLNLSGMGYPAMTGSEERSAQIQLLATETHSATAAGGELRFHTTANGTTTLLTRWRVENNGHLFAHLDNTYDIGAAGATRPRTGYFGTSLIVGAPGSLASSAEMAAGSASAYFFVDDGQPWNVQDASGVGASYNSKAYSDVSVAGNFRGFRARGSMAAPSALLAGDVITRVSALGTYDGSGTFTTGARASVALVATENWTGTAQGTAVELWGTRAGTTVSIQPFIYFKPGVGMVFSEATGAHITWATDGAGSIGALGATRPDNVHVKSSVYAGTSVLTPIVDSATAADLVLKRNGATILTLAATKGDFAVPVGLKAYTVATLPAGAVGMSAYATDLLAPTFLAAAVGGGTVKGPVFYDGTIWVVG